LIVHSDQSDYYQLLGGISRIAKADFYQSKCPQIASYKSTQLMRNSWNGLKVRSSIEQTLNLVSIKEFIVLIGILSGIIRRESK